MSPSSSITASSSSTGVAEHDVVRAGAFRRRQQRGGQGREQGRPLVVRRHGAVEQHVRSGGQFDKPGGVGGVGGDTFDPGVCRPAAAACDEADLLTGVGQQAGGG
ncbi:hypothetical protein [Protofrankia symbiont of Coriaria ruscifolia]|uniref:hypothetical protein n=1 Tax=Protofrankia symbiont of Coriaria ruscifolia TaxID=1306542 RepID=UPI0013EFC117|nr:hypothetical protein [Protofrankia symbiont of Coriaria ruscifolia]